MRIPLWTLLAAWLLAPLVAAQPADPEIVDNTVDINFPESATFRLEIEDDRVITEATLLYQVGQRSCLPAGTQVPVEADGSVLEWTWVMSRSGNPPPGAQMWWQWTVAFDDGTTITTPRQMLTFSDDRFDWRTITSNNEGLEVPISLNWYEGDDVGPILFDAAVAGLERLQVEMGIELQDEVQIFIYADSADMREALLYIQDWAGGAAFSEYSTVLIGVPPNLASTWGTATVRHELTHLVIDQFAQSCVGGGRPNWLNEGLAMYAEGEPSQSVLEDLEEGIRDNSFQPVRSLNGPFPAQREEASAAYSQSYSLVEFLLSEFGREKMQAFLLALASAEPYDRALEQVYGFNIDGLENAWRSYLGVPSRTIPPTPTAIRAADVPTVVPLGAAQSWPTPDRPRIDQQTDSTDEGTGSFEICGAAIVPFLLLVGFPGVIRRRRRQDL